jgi:hypothetical protein
MHFKRRLQIPMRNMRKWPDAAATRDEGGNGF